MKVPLPALSKLQQCCNNLILWSSVSTSCGMGAVHQPAMRRWAAMRCRYGESPAAPLVASLEAYERAIGEGAAPSPLPLYLEQQPSLQRSSRCTWPL